mgnify:CR=1 FL=1
MRDEFISDCNGLLWFFFNLWVSLLSCSPGFLCLLIEIFWKVLSLCFKDVFIFTGPSNGLGIKISWASKFYFVIYFRWFSVKGTFISSLSSFSFTDLFRSSIFIWEISFLSSTRIGACECLCILFRDPSPLSWNRMPCSFSSDELDSGVLFLLIFLFFFDPCPDYWGNTIL